jgi:hypothetical protein
MMLDLMHFNIWDIFGSGSNFYSFCYAGQDFHY